MESAARLKPPGICDRVTEWCQLRESHTVKNGCLYLLELTMTCEPRHGGRELGAGSLGLSHALGDFHAILLCDTVAWEYKLCILQRLSL